MIGTQPDDNLVFQYNTTELKAYYAVARQFALT